MAFNPIMFYELGKGRAKAFVSTWNTANTSTGSSISTQVKLPLESTGTYNFSVNWGDGNSDTITVWNAAAVTHTYATSGIYTITIKGIITGFCFNNTLDKLKMLSVISWGTLKLGNSGSYFYGCANLNLTAVSDSLNLIGTTSMSMAFRGYQFTTINNINNWDFTSITNTSYMLYVCPNFNQELSFNSLNVTNMAYMLYGCPNLNSPLSFNTASALSMFLMIANCIRFNSTITFNTGNVTDMFGMLAGCTNFNQPLNLNTAKVINLSYFLQLCTRFNQPLNLNTVNCTDMSFMLEQCTDFNQGVGGLNISKVNNFSSFLGGKTAATYSSANMDLLYNGWSAQTVKTNKTLNCGTAKYTAASSAGRAVLTSAPNNWVITDGGIL